MKSIIKTKAIALAVGAMCTLTGAVSAEEATPANKGGDITALCGDKPTRVALVDGYGHTSWRKITLAELKDEAAKCPNITEVLHAVANGDQQKYSSDINSFVAQGVDIIIAMTDFGAAPMPAYKDAQEAGVTMVPYYSDLGGTIGKDYAANPFQDNLYANRELAKWTGETLKEGNVIYLGGPPGAQSSTESFNVFKETLKDYPGIKLLEDSYIVTNWNPADAQKAVAGLIAKHPKIDAIVSDWTVTALAGIKAFEAAGLTVPPIAGVTSSNEVSCKWADMKAAGKPFKYATYDYTTAGVRFALRAGMAAFQGKENTDKRAYAPVAFADTEQGIEPICDPAAPPDADLSSLLPKDKLMALFNN